MKKDTAIFAAAAIGAALCARSTTAAIEPPSYDDPKYVRDWYAPPPDWVPFAAIPHYTGNTRTPEVVWVEYKGSWGPGLRMRPIPQKWLDKIVESGLSRIPAKERPFNPEREKNEAARRIVVEQLPIPREWSDAFTNLSFRVKADVKNAGSGVAVRIDGIGTFKTSECADVIREGDVTTYSFPISGRRNGVSSFWITVDPIEGPLEEARQEITVFDLCIRMDKAFAPFKSPAPRVFIEADGTEVTNVWERLEAAAPADVKELPVAGWAPRTTNDTGVVTEVVREKVGGEVRDCLRITWTKPTRDKQRYAVVKVPFAVDAREWNTLSFLYRMETPARLEKSEGRTLSRMPQYFLFDKYVDNPGISFAASVDRADWNQWGVTRQHLSSGRRPEAKTPAGWKAFACDMVHDDPTGNKWFTLDKIDSYEITLKNALLEDGEKAVLTIALPRLTRGLMLRGGDMALWQEFRKWKKAYKPRPYREAVKDNPFAQARLAKPLPALRGRLATFEIVKTDTDCLNKVGRAYAAELLKRELTRILTPLNEIPVLGAATTNDNVKLFLGLPKNAPKAIVDEVAAWRKANAGTPATLILNDGRNFYFAGATDFQTVGQDKGIVDGVLDFLEGNFGLIWARPVRDRGLGSGAKTPADAVRYNALYPEKTMTAADFTWGSRWEVRPAMQWWGLGPGNETFAYLNRQSFFGCWYGLPGIQFSAYRTWAANHWFGFGGGRDENEKWGMNAKGQRLRPGCYTSTPCLIKVLEDGKHDFLAGKYVPCAEGVPKGVFYYSRLSDDAMPCWIEDTWNTCQCPECLKPFRLPDGSLITKNDPDFKTEAHFVNANAYNQMVRVYANRNAQLNYLVYFYTLPVPRTPVTRYLRPHFCPYVRVNYDIPIYAPVNDKFWRTIVQWGQVARSLAVSEYYLGGNFRPRADVQAFDVKALREAGVQFYGQETEFLEGSVPEMWVASRKLYMPDWDVDAIRAYYCSRVFGAAAEDLYDFYAKIRVLRYSECRDTEFEETGWSELGELALRTPSKGHANLGEELDALLHRAEKKTRGDARAHFHVGRILEFWDWYYANAARKLD